MKRELTYLLNSSYSLFSILRLIMDSIDTILLYNQHNQPQIYKIYIPKCAELNAKQLL